MAATAVARPVSERGISERGIPWYLWCAALAVTVHMIGSHWDISWHRSIGRDTFWTPAHIAIQMCAVLAGISCGYLILNTTFRRSAEFVASSVNVFGFRGPLGAFLAAWGSLAMLTSAPFDNWWHNAYGLDVKIVSPPHTLLTLGTFFIELGAFFLIIAAMNRATGKQFERLQRMFLYIGGFLLAHIMVFLMEFTGDTHLHSSSPYITVAFGVPALLAAIWQASRNRWAATWSSVTYMLFVCGMIWVLQFFPAEPKLGPVYQPVTHFVPPPFPLLFIVPAFFLDLFLQRTQNWQMWLRAVIAGPLFVLMLIAVEWPFASFLMTPAAHNHLFAAGFASFFSSSPPWRPGIVRHFSAPEHGLVLWHGIGVAMLYAALSTWIGLGLGKWMREVQR
jgi:hypothetical protein